jgi:hypothetical protein
MRPDPRPRVASGSGATGRASAHTIMSTPQRGDPPVGGPPRACYDYPAQRTSTKYVASPAWWFLTATGTVTDPLVGRYVRPPA